MFRRRLLRGAARNVGHGHVAIATVTALLLFAMGHIATSADAASLCQTATRIPNAATTTSADGKTVHGSPCADLIVVTSPLVRVVSGGEGDDTIYANPDVEVVDGGAGDDVIYTVNLPKSRPVPRKRGQPRCPDGAGPPYEFSGKSKTPLQRPSLGNPEPKRASPKSNARRGPKLLTAGLATSC